MKLIDELLDIRGPIETENLIRFRGNTDTTNRTLTWVESCRLEVVRVPSMPVKSGCMDSSSKSFLNIRKIRVYDTTPYAARDRRRRAFNPRSCQVKHDCWPEVLLSHDSCGVDCWDKFEGFDVFTNGSASTLRAFERHAAHSKNAFFCIRESVKRDVSERDDDVRVYCFELL